MIKVNRRRNKPWTKKKEEGREGKGWSEKD